MRFFFYGTLRPGPLLAALIASFRPLGSGTIPGRLYDLGPYPAAILDEAAPTLIRGEVVDLADDPAILRRLDAYEGFDPAAPSAGLFVRRRVAVRLESGGVADCEVYLYAGDPRDGALCLEGRWEPDRA